MSIYSGHPFYSKIFEGENFFHDVCEVEPSLNVTTRETSNGGCDESGARLFKTYTTAATLFSVFGLFVGIIYDKYGTTITRLLGLVMFVVGNLFIIGAQNGNDAWLYPGLSLLCSSGIFFLTCQMQTANLFTDGAGRVLTMINGSMDTSSGTALLLVSLYNTFGYRTCWIIYACLALFILARTLFQLPKTTIPQVSSNSF